jgi:hypothetical protein
MHIYTSKEESYRWIFQPYRVFFSGAKREAKISLLAKKNEFRYLNVFRYGENLNVAYSTEKNGYDFASHFLFYCKKMRLDHVVYVEKMEGDQNAFILVQNNAIKQDKLGTKIEIKNILNSALTHSELQSVTVINYRFFTSSDPFDGKIEHLSAPFTDQFKPRSEFLFLTEKEALKKIQSRKPWILYFTFVVFAMVILQSQFHSNIHNQDIHEVTLNPYSAYKRFVGTTIRIKERMQQDHTNLMLFKKLLGWSIEKIEHTHAEISYQLIASNNGTMAHLIDFAKRNHFVLMTHSDETVLVMRTQNHPVYSDKKAELYNIEAIHHFIRDAIKKYIPNASVDFIRDIPNKNWMIRELSFRFDRIHQEDLLVLGSILDRLPASFKPGDLTIGTYNMHHEKLTGRFKITLFGDRL